MKEETIRSRLGSFSLLQKYYRKVKASVQKSRRKRFRDPDYKLKFTESDVLALSKEILEGTFKFSPLTPQEIEKAKKGTFRGLLVPAPRDRIVHKALLQILYPFFSNYIAQSPSYGVVKKRGVQKAFLDLKKILKEDYQYVLIADIQKFFNKIDRSLLEKEVFKFLPDNSVNDLISGVLKVQFKFNPKNTLLFPDENNGIPQGCSLSPLFSDVFLKNFDLEMLSSGYVVFRYIDDFMVLCKTKKEAYNAYRRSRKILKNMHLNLDPYNDEKCKAVSFDKLPTFLGVQIGSNGHFEPSLTKFNSFKQKLGQTLIFLKSPKFKVREDAFKKLNGMIIGWCGAYSMCDKKALEKYYIQLNLIKENFFSDKTHLKAFKENEARELKNSLNNFKYPKIKY